MEISSEKIILNLTKSEAYNLAYHIKNSLKQSIDSHYCSLNHDSYRRGYEGHAKPLFYKQCGEDIHLMNALLRCAEGRDDVLEKELLSYFEKKYIEKNGGLELKSNNT